MTPVTTQGKGKTGGWVRPQGPLFWIPHEQRRLNTKQMDGFKPRAAQAKITNRSLISFVILRTRFLCSNAKLHAVVIVFYFYRSPGGIVVASGQPRQRQQEQLGRRGCCSPPCWGNQARVSRTETSCGSLHTHSPTYTHILKHMSSIRLSSTNSLRRQQHGFNQNIQYSFFGYSCI